MRTGGAGIGGQGGRQAGRRTQRPIACEGSKVSLKKGGLTLTFVRLSPVVRPWDEGKYSPDSRLTRLQNMTQTHRLNPWLWGSGRMDFGDH